MSWAGHDRGLPSNWRAIRSRVLRRDGYQCTADDYGQRCTEKATEVDHISDRDLHTLENLRALCTAHHAYKTARQGAEAAKAARAERRSRFDRRERHPGLIDPDDEGPASH